jgi:hypothetical protein
VAVGGEEPLPDDRLGTRIAPLLLLTRPDVQADLGLTPEQVVAASKAVESLYLQAGALRGKPDAPDVVAARRAIDQAQTDWIQTQLSVEQQTRLLQVDLQWEGPAALLSRPIVAEALGLDSSQRRALAEAVIRARRVTPATGPRAEDARHLAESALSILTDEQQARWRAMLGRPFVLRRAPTQDPDVQSASY